jgi:protein SCO1/2
MLRLCIAVAVLCSACARWRPLPDFGQLPEFELKDQTGKPFARADLKSKVWLVDFIFTRCQSVCPRMTAEMRKLQNRIEAIPEARLLSVSIDPDHDTAAVLLRYAASYQVDHSRWLFLTGEKATIRRMQEKTERHLDPEEITVHSKHFYLVDGNGYVRGVYSLAQPGAADEMIRDLQTLVKNPGKPEARL